jgi:RNA polymerase sigma-70 factor (ECF subfamily)
MSISNVVLAERVKSNDPKAFAQLFGRYHSLVFSVCLKLLGHQQDAEDATQETFSRVARYIHRWDPDRPLEPWLIAIAGNRCRSELSRRKPLRPLSMIVESAACNPSADPWLARHDADTLREEVSLAMKRLPENHRRAFEMFHEQSLPYAKIAEQLQCPLGTVKTWVHRARAHLIESLIDRGVVNANAATREVRK